MIEEEQFNYWKKDPVTKAYFLLLDKLLNESSNRMISVNLLEDHLEARMGVERGFQIALENIYKADQNTLNQVLESIEE